MSQLGQSNKQSVLDEPRNQSIHEQPGTKKRGAQTLTSFLTQGDSKQKFKFGSKSAQGALQTVYYMLTNFEGVEIFQKTSGANPFDPLARYEPKFQTYENAKHLRSSELIYYLAILSQKEIHEFYVDFYATFDRNRNFMLDANEFGIMVKQILEKCLGPKKFQIFTQICGVEGFETKIDTKMINDMCDNFREEQSETLDYLQLFPYIFSFFMEYNYKEIVYRKERLDLMRGTEIRLGKEEEIKNIHSLLTILREMGIEYLRDKHQYYLTYRDAENLLIKLKNIQKWITFDIIKQILQQLAKLMQVDHQTGQEQQKLKLHKIIDFLTLKLCIHQNCQYLSMKDKHKQLAPSAYLEIIILWNSAMFSSIMHPKRLDEAFKTYLDKHFSDKLTFTRIDALKCLERFFKKHFQLMPKDMVGQIVAMHSQFKAPQDKVVAQNFRPITKQSLRSELYKMICGHCHEKMEAYMKVTYNGITERNNKKRQKQEEEDRQRYRFQIGKNINNDALSGSPSPKSGRSPLFPDFSAQKIQDQIKETEKDLEENEQDENAEKSEDNEDDDENGEGKEKGVKTKFRNAVRAIQMEQAMLDVKQEKKDILKACLIMDSFLQRQAKENEHQRMKMSKIQQSSMESRKQSQSYQASLLDEKQKKHEQLKIEEEQETLEKKTENLLKTKEEHEKTQKEAKNNLHDLVKKDQPKQKDQAPQVTHELQIVLGRHQRDYGPQNYKNDSLDQTALKGLGGAGGNKLIAFQAFSQKLSQKEDFQFTLNEDELQTRLAEADLRQKQVQKQRDKCQCIVM